jgi:pimeloyl-ACP methyl ester carboxylesterase/predicted glycosyltransferase
VSMTSEQREQTRARYPDQDGYVERDGIRVYWERYGEGPETILLLPTWQILYSRMWKSQIPYLARHFRVLAFDPRGNGRSDRPQGPQAYAKREFAADAIAVLDAAAVERATVVSWCHAAGVLLAAEHPERVERLIEIGTDIPLTEGNCELHYKTFEDELDDDQGWARWNRHYWLRDWAGFIEMFHSVIFSTPHSTKQIEDAVGWGLETTAEQILVDEDEGIAADEALELCARIRCPVLVVQGTDDQLVGSARGDAIAAAIPEAELVRFEGASHGLPARDPVRFNLLVHDFVRPRARLARWTRGHARRKRALYVSSPIGLGHARRDVAIAHELRRLHPDLEIDWLAQDPVTRVLEAHGERIHPASAELASESQHIASESADHDLHCFQAVRRMDEILLANFMVFHDVVSADAYDVWIGDEAWDVDYYLHENPELKTAAYCWLTDFVGWLPMPSGGEHEAFLTADYNAEMIEQIARYPRVRDRAIFVGEPDDIVPGTFGPGLPEIRDWTERHYDFAGYITGFEQAAVLDRAALRSELGYRPDEQVCIVTVGGSGVGSALLHRLIESLDEARSRMPGLRMIAVAGPRIDPQSLPTRDGLEVRSYVPDLYRHLAACDLAIVQGGLTTTMELTANKRPFLYFPLENHFEQNRHVRHRLERYGAGRRMDYRTASTNVIANAIAEELRATPSYRDVETDGAARAARLIAELI